MTKIQEYKLGAFIIDGRQFIGSIKIMENKIRYWEKEEGNVLGLKDLDELFKSNPEYLVIGTGAAGLLKVSERIKQEITAKGISIIIGKTQDVVKKYNDLASTNKKVAGIFNSGS